MNAYSLFFKNKHLSWFVCLWVMSVNSQAQEQIEDFFAMSPAELAEISVTIASGTARPAFRSAAVTTVITAEQITTMGATDLHEVLQTVPGLHASIQGVTNDYTYTMRGVANNTGNEVLFMLNGSRYSTPYKGSPMTGMELPVEAIQRIEVIRGPGSALYGADAFAGVINIITKKAGDIDGAVIGGRGGSSDNRSIWGQYGDRWLGWDVAASLQYNNNGVDNNRIITADAQTALDNVLGTQVSLAPGAMQTQGERWNAHLNLQRKYWDLGFWAFNETNQGLRSGAGGSLDNKGLLNGENYLADVRFSTEDSIENWELSAHIGYLSTDINAEIYNFPAGALLPISTNGNLAMTAFPTGLVLFPEGMRTNIGISTKVPRIQLSSIYKGFENHLIRLIAGYRYEQVSSSESRNYGVGVLDGAALAPPPTINMAGSLVDVTGTALTFLPDKSRDIWSLVLQDEWQLADNWQLTAGVRYDQYSDFGSTFNPRVALVWDVNEHLTSKLLYGQAFRAPSFLEQFQQNSQLFIGNPNLKPEKIDTTELVFDYRPVRTLRTTVNLYYYEITNLISNEASFTDIFSIQNVKNSKGQRGYGTELEWEWQFYENWNFRGNYAWQYSRNLELKRRVSIVPEQKIYSAIAWAFLPQWQVQTQLKWMGRRLSFLGDTRQPLKDYETVDVTLNGKKLFGFIDVTASARNLFDSKGKEAAVIVYPDNLPIPGRSFYVELSTHF